MLYLSGQIGMDPKTRQLVSDDVLNQTKQIFRNIQTILQTAGSDMNQIAQCRVLLTDINDFQSMNEVYASFFRSNENYPARTTFAVKSLPANAKIEIECTAYTRSSSENQILLNCYQRLTFSSSFLLSGLIFYIVLI
jgi:2-iminobutanoate/2-iminopropanoate deaminase